MECMQFEKQILIFSVPNHIFCLTETWLTESVYNNEIIPTNYTTYCGDRGSRGGGIAIVVPNTLPSRIISIHKEIELMIIEITLQSNITLICTYIPSTL